jgi:outer membrane protein assembly factor BamB
MGPDTILLQDLRESEKIHWQRVSGGLEMRLFARACLLILFTAELFAQNWPSFRGLNASGIEEGKTLPSGWDLEKSGNILWKTPVPGLAHSSPIIWNDRIFVTTAIASDQNRVLQIGQVNPMGDAKDMSRQSFRVYCLDRNSGKVLWERVAQEAEPRVRRHPKTTHASATPATDGKHLVVLFASGGLYCYDLKGKLLWSHDLGVLNANWADKPEVQWGPASSPIIYRNLVIVQCDIEKDSFIAAFEAGNGRKVWSTPRKVIPSWSTPTVYEGKKGAELIINGSEDIRGYDPLTGRELWTLRPTSRITVPTPFAADGLVYAASGYGRGIQPIYAIVPGAVGDITLKEGSSGSDQIAWSTQKGAPYITTPIVYQGYLYIAGYNGVLACYNAKTGEKMYEQRLGQGGFFSASPVAGDGKIYAISEDGEAYVIKAGPQYELLSVNPLGEICMATPALSQGMIVIRTLTQLIGIGVK